MQSRLAIGVAMLLMVCMAAPSLAQSREDQDDMKTTVEALKQRLKEQDRRMKEQDARLAELEESRRTASTQPAAKSAQVTQREAIKEVLTEMKADADKRTVMPGWLDNLKFSGDLRLRHEYNGYNWGSDEDSEKKDRNRARVRLRVGATKTWLDDQLEVGFRLASGSDNDATSTNQTFTQDFSKKPVWIDLAYARYAPRDLKGLSIIGGKMTRPWADNDIFFDSDVNPEGFWAEYKSPRMGRIEPFVGGGYFVVNESADSEDATMFMGQAGVRVEITKGVKYTFVAKYQEWTDYHASGATPRGNDKPLSRVPGFRVVNLSNNVEVASVLGRPLTLFADFAHNLGESDETADYQGERNAFATGVRYGQNRKKGDWSLKYRYAFVQANALPGHFVDSDFGFANRKGHVFGAEYNLLDNLTIGVDVLLTQPIFSPTTNSGSSAFEDMSTTVMTSLVWKF